MFESLLEVSAAPSEEIPVEQVLADYERIAAVLDAGIPVGPDGTEDTAWLDETSALEQPEPQPLSSCVPSGWLALELDHGSVDPARLSDAELIDAVIGFDRVASWALARQARILAEFIRRRPGDHPYAANTDAPSLLSRFAPDEVGLALRLSRSCATARLAQAQTVVRQLPGTLAAWEAGVIDTLKARAITETSYLLSDEKCAALEARVLPRVGQQTVAQLRAALRRAVLALDPEGAQDRYQQRRKERRVEIGPDEEGMASLWALLSAPDASAAYQRLCELARGLGADDARGMDARRADLLVDLLTGRRCAATGVCLDQDCGCAAEGDHLADAPADAPGDTVSAAECVPPEPDETPGSSADTADQTTPTAPATADLDPASARNTGRGHCCGASRPSGPGKPLISVIVPITMLLGLDEQPGELVGYGPIPADLAREIAAEGTWRRLLTDPVSGTLLDYGRTTYTPPAGLADFVRARDVYCRNPICRQRAATADLDHAVAWDDGGTTSEHNLHADCRHDHLVKTFAPGWHVDQHADGRVTWITPTGHTYTSHPYDYRPDPAASEISAPETAAFGTGASEIATSATAGTDPPDSDPPDPDPPPF